MKPKFNRPVGERNHFWRLMLADFGRAYYQHQSTTWNLHTIQPNYFAPTYSEAINLTGFAESKGLDI
jgi:hypothetical protein